MNDKLKAALPHVAIVIAVVSAGTLCFIADAEMILALQESFAYWMNVTLIGGFCLCVAVAMLFQVKVGTSGLLETKLFTTTWGGFEPMADALPQGEVTTAAPLLETDWTFPHRIGPELTEADREAILSSINPRISLEAAAKIKPHLAAGRTIAQTATITGLSESLVGKCSAIFNRP